MRKETIEKCEKVHALVGQGALIKKACKEAGTVTSTYNNWKRESQAPRHSKSRYEAISLPVVEKEGDFTMTGNPESIARFVHKLSALYGGRA